MRSHPAPHARLEYVGGDRLLPCARLEVADSPHQCRHRRRRREGSEYAYAQSSGNAYAQTPTFANNAYAQKREGEADPLTVITVHFFPAS